MRRLTYPTFIEGQPGAGRDAHFFQPYVRNTVASDPMTPNWHISNRGQSDGVNALHQEHIIPTAWIYGTSPARAYNGFLIHNTPLTFQTDIIYEFWWGLPDSADAEDRYLVFSFEDEDNYHFVHMAYSAQTRIWWRVGKVVDGTLSWSPLGTENLFVGLPAVDNLIRATVSLNTVFHTHTVTMQNIHAGHENTSSQSQGANWWTPTDEMVYAGFRWACPSTIGHPSSRYWAIKKLTFANATTARNWYLSRDDKHSWEGPFNTGSGVSVLLGDYAGGGTESADIYIKGYVAYPQICTGIAAGWKDA